MAPLSRIVFAAGLSLFTGYFRPPNYWLFPLVGGLFCLLPGLVLLLVADTIIGHTPQATNPACHCASAILTIKGGFFCDKQD